jgi:hypothetical protein
MWRKRSGGFPGLDCGPDSREGERAGCHCRGTKLGGMSIFIVSPVCTIRYSPARNTRRLTFSWTTAPAIAP